MLLWEDTKWGNKLIYVKVSLAVKYLYILFLNLQLKRPTTEAFLLIRRNFWNTRFKNSVPWSVWSLVGLRPVKRNFWKSLTSSLACLSSEATLKITCYDIYTSQYIPCCSDWDFEDPPNLLEIAHLSQERRLDWSCNVFAWACEEYKHLAKSTHLGLVYAISCSFLSLWLVCKQHLNHRNLGSLGSR